MSGKKKWIPAGKKFEVFGKRTRSAVRCLRSPESRREVQIKFYF